MVGCLLLAFAWPLFELGRFALASDYYSHILLVPFVSGYFTWQNRHHLKPVPNPARGLAFITAVLGVVLLGLYAVMRQANPELAADDSLAFTTIAFLLFLVSACSLTLDAATLRIFAFPLAFLIFMAPMPTWLFAATEGLLQHGSASVAYLMFSTVGTPVFRQDLVFHLPGIALEVAPECSGIRSTLALFITSIVAGQMFLKSTWRRTALAVAVLPLALLRNGFRVFTIGELCVHVSPDMVHSFIHRQGGPIFFLLSLVPFSLILLWLMRSERNPRPAKAPPAA